MYCSRAWPAPPGVCTNIGTCLYMPLIYGYWDGPRLGLCATILVGAGHAGDCIFMVNPLALLSCIARGHGPLLRGCVPTSEPLFLWLLYVVTGMARASGCVPPFLYELAIPA